MLLYRIYREVFNYLRFFWDYIDDIYNFDYKSEDYFLVE